MPTTRISTVSLGMLNSDVWVLLAVKAAAAKTSPTPLADILAAADMINHAILTREELNGALARLGRAGYVTASDTGEVALTPRGVKLMNAAGRYRRTWLAQWEALARQLNATPWQATDLPADAGKGEPELISTEVYQDAVARYLKGMPA